MSIRWKCILTCLLLAMLQAGVLTWIAITGDSQPDLFQRLVIAGAIITAIAGAAGLAIGLHLSRQLTRATQVLDAVAHGNLSARVPSGSGDELGQLSTALNRTIANLAEDRRHLSDDIGNRVSSVQQAAQALAATSSDLLTSSEDNTEQAQQVAASAQQVSNNAATISASAEEMSATVKEIAGTTGEAARLSAEAASRSKEVDATVQRLQKSALDIGGVVKTISSIAGQTNLLALNATIEAARAGEAGRGFAVVASEVKTLSNQTAAATNEVGQRIHAIQQDTATATQAISEIARLISRINELQQTVASAVEEQSATTMEMSRNIIDTAKGSADIAASIAAVATSARATSGSAVTMRNLGSQLGDDAKTLQRLIAVKSPTTNGPPITAPSTHHKSNQDSQQSFLAWDASYATGHPEIDAQHQELFKKTNELHTAMQQGKGRTIIGELITFLAAYTEEHFATEEQIMRQAGFTDLAQHQDVHRKLLKQVGNLQKRFAAGETLKTMEVSDFLADWLRHHILKTDHAYITCLKKAGSIAS